MTQRSGLSKSAANPEESVTARKRVLEVRGKLTTAETKEKDLQRKLTTAGMTLSQREAAVMVQAEKADRAKLKADRASRRHRSPTAARADGGKRVFGSRTDAGGGSDGAAAMRGRGALPANENRMRAFSFMTKQ